MIAQTFQDAFSPQWIKTHLTNPTHDLIILRHIIGCVPPFTHGVFHRAVRLHNANHDSRTPYCNAHPAC
jgi:hypothetical protein